MVDEPPFIVWDISGDMRDFVQVVRQVHGGTARLTLSLGGRDADF